MIATCETAHQQNYRGCPEDGIYLHRSDRIRKAEWGYGGYEDSEALLHREDSKMRGRASRVEEFAALSRRCA